MAKVQPAVISAGFCEHASKRSDVNMAEMVNEAVEDCLNKAESIEWKDIDCVIMVICPPLRVLICQNYGCQII